MTKPAERARILIVDDQPENIRMLMALLQDDYATLPATSGSAAIEKALETPSPDLILLDILMPDMDGYEVCRRLKTTPESESIPVIVISAVSEAMDSAQAFDLGAVDYITKPFNPTTVKARIKTHLKLSRTMRELQEALNRVKTLTGLLPICAGCKKIRDDQGYWNQIESYLNQHADINFSHGLCPDCAKSLYPEYHDEGS